MQAQNDFQKKVITWISDMNAYKANEKKKERWQSEYDELLESLQEIYELSQMSIQEAEAEFNNMNICKYPSFEAYAYTNADNTHTIKHNEITKTKMTRVNHKKVTCPQCRKEVAKGASLEEYYCTCGYVGEIKIKTSSLRAASDTSKHIIKLLDKITGTHKPTKVVYNITNHLVTWIVDYKYLKEWLYNDERILAAWVAKYKKLIPEAKLDPEEFFNRPPRERSAENQMIYAEFKLYTDEFYNMLEHHKKVEKNAKSNMVALSNEMILEVVNAYIDSEDEFPSSNTIFEYDGNHYELGAYINYLSLIFNAADYPIKKDVEEAFGREIRQPGLVANFSDMRSETVNRFPSKFHYGQEYVYFMHEIFHVPYPTISPVDRHHIVNLIIGFNNFYKKENKTSKGKECNAPLFACVLANILGLPYFNKYRDNVQKLLPEKTAQTESLIAHQWIIYMINNNKDLHIYRTLADELPTDSLSIQPSASVSDLEDDLDTGDEDYDFDDDNNGLEDFSDTFIDEDIM